MSIYGLGGCGKSALALELAYRILESHVGYLVFWVPALSQESVKLAYREIGLRLRIPGITDDNADIIKLVNDKLSSDTINQWLMIIDNADDPKVLKRGTADDPGSAQLRDYLPYNKRGKILFTTRSRKAAGDLTQSNVLELNDMSKAEARQLLLRRISKPTLLNDEKAIDELLEVLTYLPLAVVQAAAFINNNDITVCDYLTMFKQTGTKAELFDEYFEDPGRYGEIESTVAKTWHISFDQIQKQEPLAIEYLSFIACIDRINIPRSLLPPGGSVVQQAKAIGMLKGYAFITEHQHALQELESERFFDMHRLVHMASEWWLNGHDELAAWVTKAATRLEELIPYGEHEKKKQWTAYLPHAIYVSSFDNRLGERVRVSLLDRIGVCQSRLGQYSAAEMVHRQALLVKEKILGKNHSRTLMSMDEVGIALDNQGKYMAAEAIHQQTLAQRVNILGPEHPDTLISMANLALVLGRQGKYSEAESMNRQALVRREKIFGPEHPYTLTSMSNLALVLRRQGKFSEAESVNRQALARYEKVFGLEHPDTLISVSNLALVLDSQGKYLEAELMSRQTLARKEKVLGLEHPDTLMSMSTLAHILIRQGKFLEAESMNKQVLARSEKILGLEHPDTLMVMNNLAGALDSQGKYFEAELMNRQTLTRREEVLGSEHPDTLISMGNLAGVLGMQGKYSEAESIYRQTLKRRKKLLGLEHPDTLMNIYCLAHLLANQCRYVESAILYERACAGYDNVLGEHHPTTRACRQHYSMMLASQKQNWVAVTPATS
jgi:tetratricopeptide (TPR) repeat protein